MISECTRPSQNCHQLSELYLAGPTANGTIKRSCAHYQHLIILDVFIYSENLRSDITGKLERAGNSKAKQTDCLQRWSAVYCSRKLPKPKVQNTSQILIYNIVKQYGWCCRVLFCEACYDITDEGLKSLTACEQLNYLNISYCHHVSIH